MNTVLIISQILFYISAACLMSVVGLMLLPEAEKRIVKHSKKGEDTLEELCARIGTARVSQLERCIQKEFEGTGTSTWRNTISSDEKKLVAIWDKCTWEE